MHETRKAQTETRPIFPIWSKRSNSIGLALLLLLWSASHTASEIQSGTRDAVPIHQESQPPEATETNLKPTPTPLQIFLMAGQSNTQGHGYMDTRDKDTGNFLNGTLEWMVETFPEKYGKLKQASGDWTERDDVWISYNRQSEFVSRPQRNQLGRLAAGFGGVRNAEMGPELGFGWVLGDALSGSSRNCLLVKAAWGGKSLAVDFRPPSAPGGTTGLFYEAMVANYYKTIAEIDTIVPAELLAGGYELAGFVWHQGWNDGCDPSMTTEYQTNLAHLIRDLRLDLGVPELPVVVGVTGMVGWQTKFPHRNTIAEAQLAVADDPEFSHTVATVETRSFYRGAYPESPGNEIYHWNNNCESYWLVGKAMAEAMVGLLREKKTKGEKASSGKRHLRGSRGRRANCAVL
mmetsp:Transcript_3697/g.10475  ORF Transcript_3697/g.10475 Transcript_3697/m.10475 type:complete len:404 (+) Transcript_3697:704-1915(+)